MNAKGRGLKLPTVQTTCYSGSCVVRVEDEADPAVWVEVCLTRQEITDLVAGMDAERSFESQSSASRSWASGEADLTVAHKVGPRR